MKIAQLSCLMTTIFGFFLASGKVSYEPQLAIASNYHSIQQAPIAQLVNHTLVLLEECQQTVNSLDTYIKNNERRSPTVVDEDAVIQSLSRISHMLTKLSTLITYINALTATAIRFSSSDNSSYRTTGKAINKIAHAMRVQITNVHAVITTHAQLPIIPLLNTHINDITAKLHGHKKALSDHIRILEKTVGIHTSKH